MQTATVSIVIPLYNESDNIRPLADDLLSSLADFPYPWEVVFVDDGSTDDTREKLGTVIADFNGAASVVELQRNFGQSAAMQAGLDQARGNYLVTMDGDLQNDPADIPLMIERLIDEDLDLLVGWRKHRQDDYVSRKLPSRIANRLIGRFSGVYLNDYGCSLKVYRAEVFRTVRIYGEMHRFIPALMAMYTKTSRIKEQVVNHRSRQHGVSKYGISRTYRVLLDLLSVYFFMSFRSRPAHFFGRIGFALGIPGGLILTWLLYVKVFLGEDIGNRPLLLTGVLLIIMSIQFFSTGILAEYMTRIYYESTGTKPFIVRERSSIVAGQWLDS
ncbi:MAG: glycosyltransferase family 2 protein [Pseudomonadales bacterium]|jgi:glycosyltransferase involved in cell wall biosynthesis|nr:glycosyltransferase family 2 protein [Pseudomonadales bacterium]